MYLILNMVWYYCAFSDCISTWESKGRGEIENVEAHQLIRHILMIPFRSKVRQTKIKHGDVVEFSTYRLRIVCTCSQSRDWCATARAPVQSLKQLQWGMHGVPSHALQGLRCILRIRLDLSWSIWIFSPPCKSAHHAGQSQANSCCSCALVVPAGLTKGHSGGEPVARLLTNFDQQITRMSHIIKATNQIHSIANFRATILKSDRGQCWHKQHWSPIQPFPSTRPHLHLSKIQTNATTKVWMV